MAQETPGGLLGFAKTPIPSDARGPYRSGAVTLKVYGWWALVGTLLTSAFFLVMGLLSLVVGATLFAAFRDRIPYWDFGAGAIAGVVAVVMILMAVVVLALGLAFVAWTSANLRRWLAKDPAGRSGTLAMGIVLTAVAGLNVLMSGFAALADVFFTLPVLVLGILMIVFASNQETKAVFGGTESPNPPAPSGE